MGLTEAERDERRQRIERALDSTGIPFAWMVAQALDDELARVEDRLRRDISQAFLARAGLTEEQDETPEAG